MSCRSGHRPPSRSHAQEYLVEHIVVLRHCKDEVDIVLCQLLPKQGKRWIVHLVGRSVLIGFIQVTLAIVWLDQATQFSIQRDVGHVVRREHQQVQGIFSPSDLLLKDRRWEKMEMV